MDYLIIEKSPITPGVYWVPEQNTFRVTGNSFPEDVDDFYLPLIEFMEGVDLNMEKESIFEFRLSYFNSSSAQSLFNILEVLQEKQNLGLKLKIIWYVPGNDDDLREMVLQFKETLDELPFFIITV